MWKSVWFYARAIWPWLAAVALACATLGAVRRFGSARAASRRLYTERERERLADLETIQRRADAQRDALLQLADEVEEKARAADQLDEKTVEELRSLRERVQHMGERELIAEAQRQASRYRRRVSGGTVLFALLLASSSAQAADVCMPRKLAETLTVATAEVNERIATLESRAEHWKHDAALLRVSLSTSHIAEDTATARAELLEVSLRRNEVRARKVRIATAILSSAIATVATFAITRAVL